MFYDKRLGVNEQKVLRVLKKNPDLLFTTTEIAKRVKFYNRSLSPVLRRLQRVHKLVECERDGNLNYWGVK